ncbi:DUF4245 domain-containing protein [Homoserinibacter sp. YIM 151385]|uniref:DUF4245 domain-containing protein n=1 Tax=Homoserinibacter sp. YIM 151385 TaxID=2985506 RepID=UPI0022F12DA4|nr:DUF4245 domain-containing protein [Homoserinibacter sp. YIM 151385]WBU38077.1 DUF4245 domain-containing protein [Homoserinibacter sp. YIM 151385]
MSGERGPRIVAELGRPETPQETADRKAAASAKRRANQTALNLVIALVASLAIVAFLILVVVRPDPAPRESVDFARIGASAQDDAGGRLVIPELPAGWSSNRAEYRAVGDVPSWRIGLLTPRVEGQTGYIGFVQGLEGNASWVSTELRGAIPSGTVELGGASWTVYDQREARDAGNRAYALVSELGGSTFVLAGTAGDAEFAALAEAVAAGAAQIEDAGQPGEEEAP